ncbi:MAG: hypothetical protein ACFHWX_21920 [Bacteroidota bacterium]
MYKPVLLVLISLLIGQVHSQAIRKPVTALLGWSHAGQQQDYLMGMDMGVQDESQKFHYFLSFDFRPYRRKVQEFVGNNTFYQYQEERYVVTIGTRYLWELQNTGKGVFMGVSTGYNWGKYRGLSYGPDEGWIIRPNAGLFWNLYPDLITLELGYEYFNSRSDAVKDHWVFLTFLLKMHN